MQAQTHNPNPIPIVKKKIPKIMCSYIVKVHKAKALQNKYFIHKSYICNAVGISS